MNMQSLPSLTPNRWIEQKAVGWPKAIAAIALILFGLPVVVAIFEGVGDLIFVRGNWRNLFLQPSITLYAVIVSKPMLRTRSTVAQALRPVLPVDDDAFDEVVNHAARPIPHGELVGFMSGSIFAIFASGSFIVQEDAFWTSLYSYSSSILMWGVVGWMIYGAIYVTQFT